MVITFNFKLFNQLVNEKKDTLTFHAFESGNGTIVRQLMFRETRRK